MKKGIRATCAAFALIAMAALAHSQQVSKVVIKGNSQYPEATISASLRIRAGQTVTDADLRREEENLLSLGVFRSVKVMVEKNAAGEYELIVSLVEYPVVKEVRITGNETVPTAEILAAVNAAQKVGSVWNNRNADVISKAVRALYQKRDMIVNFTQIGPMAESPNTLTISILEPKIGDIELVGLVRTKPETIKRIMRSKPGAPFRRDVLRKDLEDLAMGTNWFEKLEPDLSPGNSAGETNVKLTFKEARTALFKAGVALDAQSRLLGTIDVADTNFRGLGQSVGLSLSQAATGGGPSAEVSFANRFYDSMNTEMNIRLFSKVVYNFTGSGLAIGDTNTADRFDERRTGIGLTFSRPYGEKHRASIGLIARNARTLELNTNVNNTSDFIQQDGDLISLQIGAEYNAVRGGLEPYRGDAFSTIVEPGYSKITKVGGNLAGATDLIGTSNFVRFTGDYRRYWSKEPKKKVDEQNDDPINVAARPTIAFRTKFGYISGTVPFFEQMFLGGTDSLRGYDNQRFWGSRSILSTVEYRYPIQKTFTLAAFADYGSAWGGYGQLNGFGQTDNPNFRLGYGLGLGFKIQALGQLRIDFALNQEGSNRTHFSFGTSF